MTFNCPGRHRLKLDKFTCGAIIILWKSWQTTTGHVSHGTWIHLTSIKGAACQRRRLTFFLCLSDEISLRVSTTLHAQYRGTPICNIEITFVKVFSNITFSLCILRPPAAAGAVANGSSAVPFSSTPTADSYRNLHYTQIKAWHTQLLR